MVSLIRKLTEHGVRKVIPDKARLEDAYRLFVRSDRTKAIVEEAIAGMADEPIAVPRDLDKQVRAVLRKEPALSWEQIRSAAFKMFSIVDIMPP